LEAALIGTVGQVLLVLARMQAAQLGARKLGRLPVALDERAVNLGLMRVLRERPRRR
jgi:hypothetical protein